MKKKRSLILIILSVILLSNSAQAAYKPSPPDIAGSWAEKHIQFCIDENLFTGYPDGTFRGGENLSYGQVFALVVRLIEENELLQRPCIVFESILPHNGSADYFNMESLIGKDNMAMLHAIQEGEYNRDTVFEDLQAVYSMIPEEEEAGLYLFTLSQFQIKAVYDMITGEDTGKAFEYMNRTHGIPNPGSSWAGSYLIKWFEYMYFHTDASNYEFFEHSDHIEHYAAREFVFAVFDQVLSAAFPEYTKEGTVSYFTDLRQGYERIAANLYMNEIVTGYTDKTLRPGNNIQRDEMAAILHRVQNTISELESR